MSSDARSSEQPSSETASVARLEHDNAQLRAELARVNAERIEYLQNVSHQLVAPLNAIKWHIENITSNRVGVERAKKVLRSIWPAGFLRTTDYWRRARVTGDSSSGLRSCSSWSARAGVAGERPSVNVATQVALNSLGVRSPRLIWGRTSL